MSSSSLLRFLLVTATFYPAVGTDEENTARMRRRVDSIWWAVALRREKGGGWNRKKGNEKKKKKTVTRVRRNLRSRPYPPTVYTVYYYIYTIMLDRRFFPNERLLETHCYIYIYQRICIIYLYTATISATMYIYYIVATGLQF